MAETFGKIRVTGKDRIDVLHNILTQDIKSMKFGDHALAALLSNTGKVLIFMEVFMFEDFLILVVENGLAMKSMALIDKYIISEDVVLEDITEKSFEVKIEALLEPERIKAGVLRYGIDMNENTILSETGLDKVAVSSTKGCYPGQEVVARIETYKGLNRHICKFSFAGDLIPKSGSKVFLDGQEIGWITSATQGAALGYVAKGYFDKELTVEIESEGKRLTEVQCTPHQSPQKRIA